MDTMQLRLFVSAAKTLNFSRTAEQFFISQPAVTHSIKILEASLGAKLFDRTGRKIVLTEEGAEFLPYAVRALETLNSAEMRIQNMAQGQHGVIRVAALSSSASLLSACISNLRRKLPSIQVEVDILDGTELIDSIRKGSYNFYFAYSEMLTGMSNYTFSLLSRERLELFVNKSVSGNIDLNDWSTMKMYPFIFVSRSDVWLAARISRILKNRGLAPNTVVSFNRIEAAAFSVNVGTGISILPGVLKNLLILPDTVTFPIAGDETGIELVLAWKHTQNTFAGQLFRDAVNETTARV